MRTDPTTYPICKRFLPGITIALYYYNYIAMIGNFFYTPFVYSDNGAILNGTLSQKLTDRDSDTFNQ